MRRFNGYMIYENYRVLSLVNLHTSEILTAMANQTTDSHTWSLIIGASGKCNGPYSITVSGYTTVTPKVVFKFDKPHIVFHCVNAHMSNDIEFQPTFNNYEQHITTYGEFIDNFICESDK